MINNKAWQVSSLAIILSIALSGCMTIVDYQSIRKNVRLATTYESEKRIKVIGKRIEMQPEGSMNWYEAEKNASGAYVLTPLGSSNKQSDENIPDEGGGGGCN